MSQHASRAGDGRSPDSRVAAQPNLPGQCVQWCHSVLLSAHSCGGSHGFGACWLRRTVFPFHLAYLWRARTITRISPDFQDMINTKIRCRCAPDSLPNDAVYRLNCAKSSMTRTAANACTRSRYNVIPPLCPSVARPKCSGRIPTVTGAFARSASPRLSVQT